MANRILYIAEIDGDTSFQHVTLEILDENAPAYITISARKGHVNDENRALTYKYSKGELYEEIEEYSRDEQRYKLTPYTGKVNEYVQRAKEDLDKLRANSEGKKLLDFFEKRHKLSICATLEEKREGESKSLNNCNQFNVNYQGLPVKLPVENHPMKQPMPSYIVLGHEIAHAMSYHLKTQDLRYWKGDTMLDEIYATHVENKIRRSAGLPLRNYYNYMSERMFGDKHYSLYINKNEDYPSNPPKEILNSKEAFDYDSIQPDK